MDDSVLHRRTNAFRGATFEQADLQGATFRESDLRGARIVGSIVDGLRIDGFDGEAGRVVVDGVEVTAFVREELDRRFPERVQVRTATSVDELRDAWVTVESLWAATVAEASTGPGGEAACQRQVDGEWSMVDTLRHLVFAIDTWVGRMILQRPAPEACHPLGLPPTDLPPEDAARLGLTAVDRPATLAEAVAAHDDRRAQVHAVLRDLTDAQLEGVRSATFDSMSGEVTETVRLCVQVVLREHVEHRRFVLRDLAAAVDVPS